MDRENVCLETPRLRLRPWKESDAESLYKYAKEPAIGLAAGWPSHTSVENSRDIIRTVFSAPETYAMVLKETDEPIGCIGVMFGDNVHSRNKESGDAEIGYWVGMPHWGKGLTTEAMLCIVKRCFVTLNVPAVWCGHYERNIGSRRVMDRVGGTGLIPVPTSHTTVRAVRHTAVP